MPPWSAWQKHPTPQTDPCMPNGSGRNVALAEQNSSRRERMRAQRQLLSRAPEDALGTSGNSLLPSEAPHFFHTGTPFPSYCWAASGKEGTEEKWVIANGPCFGVSPSEASRSEELPGDSVQQRVVPKAPGFNREGSGRESPWRKALCQREPGKRRPTILPTSPSPEDHENLPLQKNGTVSCA